MQRCQEGRCTEVEWCLNDYNAEGKRFQRTFWLLHYLPCDIPPEAELVDLTGNIIKRLLPNVFVHLSQCRELVMRRNSMTTIEPGAFNGLGQLLSLELHQNHLSFVRQTRRPSIWIGLDKLEKLDLGFNKISEISSGAFQGLKALKLLWLSENSITDLEKEAFSGLDSLRNLKLDKNYLTSLDQEVFSFVPRPLLLSVGYPQWSELKLSCSALCWLKEEEEQTTITFERNRYPICTGGIHWKNFDCDGKSLLC